MWSAPVGYGELARGLEPMRSGEIFWISNKRNECCVDTGANSSEMDSLWSTSVWIVYYKEWCVSWNQKNSFFIFNFVSVQWLGNAFLPSTISFEFSKLKCCVCYAICDSQLYIYLAKRRCNFSLNDAVVFMSSNNFFFALM